MLKTMHAKISAILLLVITLVLFGVNPAAAPGTDIPDHIILSLATDPTTSITVTWRTSTDTNASMIQYAAQSGFSLSLPSSSTMVNGTVSFDSTGLGPMNIHRVTLTNLKPGTSYFYRVGDGNTWSDVCTFKTEPLNDVEFRAVLFSDTQSGSSESYNYAPWETVLTSAIGRENPDFTVIDGDLVEEGGSQKQWEAWFEAVKGTLENTPLMPVVGNHETFINGAKPTAFTSQFTVPSNGPSNLQGQVYSFDYGPVHFVVLDSQGQEEGSNILDEQKQWLENDLKVTAKNWKVVFFHKPPYPLKDDRANNDVKAAFCTILEQSHVDLVVNGHDHAVGHTYPIYNGVKANSTAKGTIYATLGRAGAKYYPDVSRKPYDLGFYNPKDQPVYSLLLIKDKQFQLITKKADGTVVDSFTIDEF